LADGLNLGNVALGGLIHRLMKNQLIDRKPDELDKRVDLIFLSRPARTYDEKHRPREKARCERAKMPNDPG